MFDIKTLCQRSNISQQTFYRLSKENEEFRELVLAERKKRGNGFLYPDSVLQWLMNYYAISDDKPADESKPTAETPVEAPQSPSCLLYTSPSPRD